jgi:hypothetical protein
MQARATSAIALTVAALLVAPSPVAAHGADRLRVRSAPSIAVQYGTAVVDFDSGYTAANTFDPREVAYAVVATRPDGSRLRMPAFWYQDYERSLVGRVERLQPRGEPHWRARLTVDQPGGWTWHLEGLDRSGWTASREHRLRVTPSDHPGFLRRSPLDDRYLAFDDGSSYFAVGENLAWYDARGTFAYDEWLDELAGTGANFVRLWMPSWAFGIEWNDTGLGDYTLRLHRAWQLDHVLAEAEERGIQVELALLNHGAYSTAFNSEWDANPYNALNGGPITSPEQFFTNAAAKALFKQRLRYIVARWGAATNLMAWEFWNEVDLTDRFDGPVVAAWHREMSAFVRLLDPYDHLISSSTALFFNEANLWSRGGLDFAQVHFYSQSGGPPLLPNFFTTVPDLTELRRDQAAIPVLFAELGVDSRGPAETIAVDPAGIGVHDGLWAGLFSDGFGTAMAWWWDNVIHPDWDRYRPLFAAVARITRGIRFDRERFVTGPVAVDGAPPEVAAHALVGRHTALVWVKDQRYQWTSPVARDIAGASVTVPLRTGLWCGRWSDTWTSARVAGVEVTGGTRTIPVPAFDRDLVLRLRRCD